MFITEYALHAAENAYKKLQTKEVQGEATIKGSYQAGATAAPDEYVLKKPDSSYTQANFIRNYLTAKVSRENFVNMLQNDIPLPISVIMARPFCTYQMGTAILARGGLELGMTAHGHHDFQLVRCRSVVPLCFQCCTPLSFADPSSLPCLLPHRPTTSFTRCTWDTTHSTGAYKKVWHLLLFLLHARLLTCLTTLLHLHSRSIVKDSKLLAFADNVFACGYHGGENTEFATDDDIHNYLTEAEVRKTHGSIIPQVAAVPFRGLPVKTVHANNSHRDLVTLDIPNPICLHGHIPGAYLGAGISPNAATLWTSRDFLLRVHNQLEDRMINADDGVEPFVGSATTISHLNSLCFQEQQQDGSGGVTIQGTGHWGAHCYDGCGAARTGAYSELMQHRENHGGSLTYTYS